MKKYKIIFKILALFTITLYGVENVFSEEILTSKEIKALGHQLRTEPQSKQKEILDKLQNLKEKASPATSEILASIHEEKTGKEAIDILFSIGTEPAIAGLARLISNKNEELGIYILDKMVLLKSKAQAVVEEIFSNYENKKLKEKIIFALGEIKGDIAFYKLKELLKSNEQEKIKILVLQSFLKFDDAKKELPLLRKLFRKSVPSDFADALLKAINSFEK